MSERESALGSRGRFLLVDQSLTGYHGHHLEYDRSVALAASRQGWDVTIAAHRSLPRSFRSGEFRFLRIFRTTWDDPRPYSAWTRLRRWVKRNQRLWPGSGLSVVARYVRAGAMMLARKSRLAHRGLLLIQEEWGSFRRRAASLRRHLAVVRVLPFARLFWPILGAPVRLLWKWATRPGSAKHGLAFRVDLVRAIERSGAGPEDLVFLHTLNLGELEEVLSLLSVSPLEEMPRFHVLLRREASETLGLSQAGLSLRTCLRRFYESEVYPRHVRFYTDTERLTKEYDRLSGIRFSTLPIPLRQDMIGAYAKAEKSPDDVPNVVYLGDARPEKGYQFLPGLVGALWSSHLRSQKARFTLQSNFNLPGGEHGMPEIRRQLRQYPAHQVTLLEDLLSERDYYRHLGEANIVLVPYLREAYSCRSSGIFAEALAAGKPVVVPEDTWMADQLDRRAGRTFADPEGLATAVSEILADYDSFAQAARSHAPRWQQLHCGEALVLRLLDRHAEMMSSNEAFSPGLRLEDRPTLLFFMQADAFVYRTGSFMVAKSQLDYFRRSGYRVFAVLTVMDVMAVDYDRVRWTQRVLDAVDEFDLAGAWVLHFDHKPSTVLSNLKVVASRLAGRASVDADLRTYRGFAIPRDLQRLADSGKVDAVFINYAATLGLVRKLRIAPDTPIICEMVDIQAHQHAIHNGTDGHRNELEREIALLDSCDSVIAISPIEMEAIGPNLRRASIHYAPKHPQVAQPSFSALAGARDLAELLRASGSNLDIVNEDRGEEEDAASQVARLRRLDALDLLFVSTSHVPNIQSFDWFHREVFLPHLANRGVTVLVAGTIYWNLLHKYSHPQLFFGGLLDSLDTAYSACPLVILPITAGAGTNIKTLEALAMGKPIVGTRMAFRGLPAEGEAYPTFDQPERFAARILELLAHKEERLELVEKGFRLLDAPARSKEFDSAMGAAFQAALGDRARSSRRSPMEIPEAHLVEWSREISLFNRLMRDYVEIGSCSSAGRSCEDPEIQQVLGTMRSEEGRRCFKQLYESFMEERTAPVLCVHHVQEPLEALKDIPSYDGFVRILKSQVDETAIRQGLFR